MIAVTFALPAEGRDFVRRLRRREQRSDRDLPVVPGRLGDEEIEVLHTGVGQLTAGRRVRAYLDSASPKYLIAAGFAGATKPGCRIGEIILGENYSNATLLSRAEEALRSLTPTRGKIFTAPEVIDRPTARDQLWREQGVLAVEMESSVIVSAAAEKGIPVLALRSVSDTPEQPFPLPPGILFDVERQRTVLPRLGSYLVANPRALPRLIRFSRQIGIAKRALADALTLVLTPQPSVDRN